MGVSNNGFANTAEKKAALMIFLVVDATKCDKLASGIPGFHQMNRVEDLRFMPSRDALAAGTFFYDPSEKNAVSHFARSFGLDFQTWTTMPKGDLDFVSEKFVWMIGLYPADFVFWLITLSSKEPQAQMLDGLGASSELSDG